MVEISRERFLADYIDSRGSALPADYHLFAGGQYRELCVFCGNVHELIPVFRYNPINDSREPVIDLFCCYDCDGEISNKLLLTYYPMYMDSDESWEVHSEIQRVTRIDEYNNGRNYGQFYSRYTYLSPANENYVHTPVHSCAFCDRPVPPSTRQVTIPVVYSKHLTGGHVYVCERDFPSLTQTHQHVRLTCCRCDSNFLVENRVHLRDVDLGLVGNRMCPSCTYIAVNNLPVNDALLSMFTNIRVRSQPIIVWKTLKCSVCSIDFVIDLAISHKLLHTLHFTSGKIHCANCYRLGVTKANGNKIAINVHDNIFVIVLKSGAYWQYIICKVIADKAEHFYRSAPNFSSNISDAITAGVASAWELFPLNNQREVFDGDS